METGGRSLDLDAARVRVAVEAAACAEPELAALELARSGGAAGAGRVAPGGAAVGRVIEAGEGAAHLVGRRVLVGPIDGCGECDLCRRALPFACAAGALLGATAGGALGGEVSVRARWALPLDGGLELEGPAVALVAREAADAYALAARVGLGAGDRVAVHGRGPVAALVRQVAALRGARLVDADAGGAGADRLVVAGDVADLARALDGAGPGAVVAVLSRDAAALAAPVASIAAFMARGGTLLGVVAAHPDLLPEVVALAVKGDLDLAAVAELWRPPAPALECLDEVVARLRAALHAGRALVVENQLAK